MPFASDFREAGDLPVRAATHLVAHQCFIYVVVPQRGGDITRLGEGAHQCGGERPVERFCRGKLAAIAHRVAPGTRGFGVGGQPVDGGGPEMIEARALLVCPVLELARVLQVDAVEKRACVERSSHREVARSDCLLEFADVARDQRGVEAE